MGRSIEFPENFKFGGSQSGFQFEMGDHYHRYIDPNSDWWVWVRDPYNISTKLVSGDLPEDGDDYLELYRSDHEMYRRAGLSIFRLNIEWSRIFPHPTWLIEVDVDRDANGLIKSVKIDDDVLRKLDMVADRDAVSLYRDIINDLRARGFKVILNLHHFTTPLWLHNPIKARASNLTEGPLGILEESFSVEYAKFAAYAAWRFGDLVDMWSLSNEPMVPVTAGYMNPYSGFPPGVRAIDKLPTLISNWVVAHALAYDMIRRFDTIKVDRDSRGPAEVGIIYNLVAAYPLTPSDEGAAENLSYFYNDIFLNALVNGALDTGLNRKDLIRPAALGKKLDWIGINYYTRTVVRRAETQVYNLLNYEPVPGYGGNCPSYGVARSGRPCAQENREFWPEGLARVVDTARRYSDTIYITENSCADPLDILRPAYFINHVYILSVLIERGINIKGYMWWGLLDNYRWQNGFRHKQGFWGVDFETKVRRPRPSVKILEEVATSRRIEGELLDKYLIQMEPF